MNKQYCKVGKIRLKTTHPFSLKELENKAIEFVESVSNKKNTKDLNVIS